QGIYVGVAGEIDPQEVAALGRHEACVGQVLRQRVAQGLSTLAQGLPDRLDRAGDSTRAAELVDDRLRDHARRDVGARGDLGDAGDQVRWANQVADPDARANRL